MAIQFIAFTSFLLCFSLFFFSFLFKNHYDLIYEYLMDLTFDFKYFATLAILDDLVDLDAIFKDDIFFAKYMYVYISVCQTSLVSVPLSLAYFSYIFIYVYSLFSQINNFEQFADFFIFAEFFLIYVWKHFVNQMTHEIFCCLSKAYSIWHIEEKTVQIVPKTLTFSVFSQYIYLFILEIKL